MRRLLSTVLSLAALSSAAFADGRLKFTVVDAETKKPLPGAIIVLDPDETELVGVQFVTDSKGKVETGELTAGVRGFRARATVDGIVYRELKGRVTVIDNQDVEIDLELDSQRVIEIRISDKVQRLDTRTTSIYTQRDRRYLSHFPLGVANRPSIERQLVSIPGFARDSVNRVHPRGEDGSLAWSVDGFLLPPTALGRATAFLLPSTIETLRAHVGGYSAFQGGASGAFLETRLRPALYGEAVTTPGGFDGEWNIQAGGFGTSNASLFLGRQTADASRGRAGYYLALERRFTANGLETPQPDEQRAANGQSETDFSGKVEFEPTPGRRFAAFFAVGQGRSGVGNRTGIGDAAYLNSGQGYGFGGLGNQSDFPALPGDNANFRSQRVLGNNVSQRDENRLFVLQHGRDFGKKTQGTLSWGFTRTRQDVTNRTRNPLTNLNNLPADSSVEFLPTVRTGFDYSQIQADFTTLPGEEGAELRYGLLHREQTGGEFYRIAPQSQRALDALRNIDPTLGPLLTSFGPNGDQVTPLNINRSGSYSAAYVQGTVDTPAGVRVGAGFRADRYVQTQATDLAARRGRVSFSKVSPRVSALYSVPGKATVVRASFGQVVTLPGTGQGAIAINPVRPQTAEQTDLSVEKQIGNQNVRLNVYRKELRDTIAYRQLVPGPQHMAYQTVNAGRARAGGWELAYELNPRDLEPAPGALEAPTGFNAFGVLHSGYSRFLTPQGEVATDQDQGTTLTLGVGYRFPSGMEGALSLYRGSGLASSALRGSRSTVQEVNLRLATPHDYYYGRYGIELGIENLFNGQGRLNFNSAFAGTRFQPGRRIAISVFGRY